MDRARQVYKRFVSVYPQPSNWLKWAKFEEQHARPGKIIGKFLIVDFAREIYQQCMTTLGDDFIDQNFYISFAKFETRLKEIERARVIYKYAMQKLPEGQKENLHNVYTQFEKQFGGKEGIEQVVASKRRLHYEAVNSLLISHLKLGIVQKLSKL
jgi:crooked neck